jgi:hypothetical protein
MTRPPRAPRPPRIVNYRVIVDSLGTYIAFATDDVLLPRGVLPHQLPSDATLRWTTTQWHFRPREMSAPMGAHELRRLFLEFAEQMYWDVRLQP